MAAEPFQARLAAARRLLGIHANRISHAERLASVFGSLVGIGLVYAVSSWWLDASATLAVVASMGASAVLLFAVPHGALSQPWPLVGGHLVSAAVGVACARWIDPPWLAAALAVAGAVGAMHYLRCIHPPGGATALAAVIGGPTLQSLGFAYLLTPVALNVGLILLAALACNALFPWRRYPIGLVPPASAEPQAELPTAPGAIAHEDFVYALSEIDTFVDIDESDLLRIYELATSPPELRAPAGLEILPGHCYSNARHGSHWAVRKVVDLVAAEGAPPQVVYRNLAGVQSGQDGSLSLPEFRDWARHEVYYRDRTWHRVL